MSALPQGAGSIAAHNDGPTGLEQSRRQTALRQYRAVVLSLFLIPLIVLWIEYTEIVTEGPDMAAMSLPIGSMCPLLILVAINLAIRKRKPELAFTQSELLLVFSMTTVAVYVSGLGMVQFLQASLVGWQHYSTPHNNWTRWHHLLASWALPDVSVIPAYYDGHSSLFTRQHLRGWTNAIVIWTTFIAVLFYCMQCVVKLFQNQWIENEKITFPIIQIPIEITQDGGATPLWRNKVFWSGASLAIALELMSAIHFCLIPGFPYIPLKPANAGTEACLQIDKFVTTPPWNSMGYTTLSLYPFVVGLAFLLPADLSLSCWLFYVIDKLELVASAALGYRGLGDSGVGMPYIFDQGVGAYAAIAVMCVWLSRNYLKSMWSTAFAKSRTQEGKNNRSTFIGLMASGALLIAFGVGLGLSPLLSTLFFAAFILLSTAMMRIRAEAGLAYVNGPGPDGEWGGIVHTTILDYAGTRSVTPHDLSAFSLLRWCDNNWRGSPEPAIMEAGKGLSAEQRSGSMGRRMSIALMCAVVVGALAAWVSCLDIYYHYGAESAHVNWWRTAEGSFPFDELNSWLQVTTTPSHSRITAAVVGFGITLALYKLRSMFVWWPLHPIGYAINGTSTMTYFWFPVLLGWIFKVVALRYGGLRLYRTTLPFFYGLIVGDYAVSGLIAFVSMLSGHTTYRTFPV